MLTNRLKESTRASGSYWQLVVGSIVVALLVSLGTVGVLTLLGMEVHAALPAALAAVAAAGYAVATKW